MLDLEQIKIKATNAAFSELESEYEGQLDILRKMRAEYSRMLKEIYEAENKNS